jgi:LmbE family N-acetylglucosaminyl deacetylase
MKRQDKKYNQQQKSSVLPRVSLVLLACAAAYFAGSVLLFVVLAVCVFIVNDLFFADHNFYSADSDYRYSFNEALKVAPVWSESGLAFSLPEGVEQNDSALLAVRVEHKFSGKFFDPYVTVRSGKLERKQYFERSVVGLRYINISELLETGEPISFDAEHCCLDQQDSELYFFANESLDKKKVLVIAPHADDAEIAAFGLYSTMDSFIFTVTAGEVGAEAFESMYASPKQASLMKGRLRAWDSIAIPQWAGLKPSHTVQAGYFCLCLKTMHDAPEKAVVSKTSGVSDTREFRTFNHVKLKSDAHGTANWKTLLEDLNEVINTFKPDCIVTPHHALDPHEDHHYTSLALSQVLEKSAHQPSSVYLYANHLRESDMFPFGPVHTLASLPPQTGENMHVGSFVSVPLTLEQQKDKAEALGMMHDLQTPLRWKKKVRFWLQSIFIGRELSPYGEDEYFRKAIRSNELFFSLSVEDWQAGK